MKPLVECQRDDLVVVAADVKCGSSADALSPPAEDTSDGLREMKVNADNKLFDGPFCALDSKAIQNGQTKVAGLNSWSDLQFGHLEARLTTATAGHP